MSLIPQSVNLQPILSRNGGREHCGSERRQAPAFRPMGASPAQLRALFVKLYSARLNDVLLGSYAGSSFHLMLKEWWRWRAGEALSWFRTGRHRRNHVVQVAYKSVYTWIFETGTINALFPCSYMDLPCYLIQGCSWLLIYKGLS